MPWLCHSPSSIVPHFRCLSPLDAESREQFFGRFRYLSRTHRKKKKILSVIRDWQPVWRSPRFISTFDMFLAKDSSVPNKHPPTKNFGNFFSQLSVSSHLLWLCVWCVSFSKKFFDFYSFVTTQIFRKANMEFYDQVPFRPWNFGIWNSFSYRTT